jgi:DNA ligase (NAD+)
MKDMEKLVNKLNEAAKNYYSESEVTKMSDHEYDRLYDELVAMEKETGVVLSDSPTLRVGYAVVSGLKKITHKYPALSLDKTKDPQVLVKWADEKETVLSWKEDGLTLVATYLNGELESAVTRGNGYIGEDVTHNAPYISGLPQKIPFKEELVVRGEVLISYKDFETINESGEYANPRNLAASSLRA